MPYKVAALALAMGAAIGFASSAEASVLYDSGAPNGTIAGVNIGYDTEVADSFVLTQDATVTGVNFTSWDYPNSSLATVGYALQTTPGLPATLSTANIAPTSYLFTQQPNGYWIDENAFSVAPTTLTAGVYYLVLGDATGSGGGYWDENDGASSSYGPYGPYVGQSEAFQITGVPVSAAPEPSIWALMMAGVAGIGLLLRQAKTRSAPKAQGCSKI